MILSQSLTLLAASKNARVAISDLTDTSFGRRCCWLSFYQRVETGENALFLRTTRGQVQHRTLLRLELWANGKIQPARVQVSAGCVRLELRYGSGQVECVIASESTVRVRLFGVQLRISMEPQPYSSSFVCKPGRWHLNYNAARTRLMIRSLVGGLTGTAPTIPGKSDTEPAILVLSSDGTKPAEMEITEFESSWVESKSADNFDTVAAAAEGEFNEWFAAFGAFTEPDQDLARRAAYVLWSNTAPAGGNYSAPAVMMSQNSLVGIWSWDHCFVALALARAHPQQAWEQWWLPFALQTREGMLPDAFTEASREFAMTKPPVHGWALQQMLPHLNLSTAQLEMAHDGLERWTSWWLTQRDDDGDGIAQYNHGCESGWDNDSICSNGIPCETPDLSVYLIQQYEALAMLATRLGRNSQAQHWRNEADALWVRLQGHSWPDGHWLALQSGSHKVAQSGDCLRLFWPLLLGSRLEEGQRKSLLQGLTQPGRFRTAHGFATEAVNSTHYQANGYWLGPIWAPSTFQVVEMLRINGRPEEAAQTARAFCELCRQHGFRENFDAQTGAGLCDRGFAWTAAVCLYFLQDFAKAS